MNNIRQYSNNKLRRAFKKRRQAFNRVLSATSRGESADEDDILTLMVYCNAIECGADGDPFNTPYRPLYTAIRAILPDARQIWRQYWQNDTAV